MCSKGTHYLANIYRGGGMGCLIGQVGRVGRVGGDLREEVLGWGLFIGEELGEYFVEGLFGLVLFEVEGLPVGDVEVFACLE